MNNGYQSNLENRRWWITFLAILFIFSAHSPAGAKDLYKLIDKNGKVSYQDRPAADSNAVSQEIIKPTIASQQNNAGLTTSELENQSVIVYTLEDCDSCEILMLRLKQLGVPAQEQSLLGREIQSRILSETDQLTAPTMLINDKLIIDNSEDHLIEELKLAGYLKDQNSETDEPVDGAPDDQQDPFYSN